MKKCTFLLILICLCCCGGGNEKYAHKRANKLQGLEDAIPLGEVKVENEKPVDQQKLTPSQKDPLLPDDPTNAKEEVTQEGDRESLNSLLEDEKNNAPVSDESNSNSAESLPSVSISPAAKTLSVPFSVITKQQAKVIALTYINNTLFSATRYSIVQIEDGKETTILNQAIFKKTFNQDMPAISTIAALKENGLWIGFTNGLVIQFQNGVYSLKSGGPAQKKQRIEVIKEVAGRVFIGSKGFFEWDKNFDRFMSNDEVRNETITDITELNDEFILFTTLNSIFKMSLKDRTSVPFYRSFTGDYPIRSIVVEGSDIYIGGRQGILILNSLGYPESRFGSTHSLIKLHRINKDVFAFIDTKQELHLIRNKKLIANHSKPIKATSLSSSHESLYIGNDSGEVIILSFPDLLTLVSQIDQKKSSQFTKKYANACEAANELLKGRFYSRQISAPIIDKKRFVFFNGNQVCPSQAGYMKGDGSTAILNDKHEIELFEYNKRKVQKLPNEIQDSDILKIFLDSQNVLFLGTQKGLYILAGNQWQQVQAIPELNTDQITDIIEDKRGNIWVTSRIKAKQDDSPDKDSYKPLHIRVNSDSWVSFGKSNGISALGISSIREHEDGIYFSNANGYFVIYANSKLAHYSQPQGLKNYIVENLNFDSKNRMWLTHGYFQNGLSWIDGSHYYLATKDDGLFSNRIIDTAEDDDDLLWIMDSAGEIFVTSYETLENIAKKSAFHSSRVSTTDFIP